jgi:hypothetical protein
LPGAIQDQEFMLEQKRLGNDGTGTARSEPARQGAMKWMKRTTDRASQNPSRTGNSNELWAK